MSQVIYGFHAVLAVLQQSPQRIEELLLQQGRQDNRIQQICNLAQQHGIKFRYCDRTALDKIISDAPHQGVIAVTASLPPYTEDDLEQLLDQLVSPFCILILDGIQDPHNLGACLRTADAAGCSLVIAPKDRAVGITPTVRKVASGATESIPFIQVTNLARTLRCLKDRGVWLYGADSDATQSLFETSFAANSALLLGAEEKGLRRLTRELCDYLISIPMTGSVSSLNVSVATAVCLYEVMRQRSAYHTPSPDNIN